MTTFPDFSRLLVHHLAQSDRSPAWLARRLEVHPGTVSRWLNEATRPAAPEVVIRVADLLGVYSQAERSALLAAAGFAYQEGGTQTLSPAAHPPRVRLPRAATSFVGREQEMARLVNRMIDPAVRLVTLVGPGGMGKSRLAVAAAKQILDAAQFADGIYFVPLAAVTNAGLIPSAIVTALEIPTQGAPDLEAHLIRYLSDKQLLLILDNLEQLLDGAPLLDRLLASAPGLKVLATSRVRLQLNSEWLFPLAGLTIPPANDPSLLTAAESTAIALFVERARRLQPDFALSAATAPEISHICRLVDGMPLAIELAAAWLRVLPLAEIAAEVEANLDFLTAVSPSNDADRHRSMRAVFDHSWRLLAEAERQALLRVSLFRGGFTRQAAAEVAGAELHTLSGLVDSSWIQLNPQGRYEIHELARQYAESRLEEDAALAAAARAAHCVYFAALSKRLEGRWGGLSGHGQKLQTLLLEIDNIWAGWRWATATRNLGALDKYIVALSWLADARGLYSEVVEEFETTGALLRASLSNETLAEVERRQIALGLAALLSELCFL